MFKKTKLFKNTSFPSWGIVTEKQWIEEGEKVYRKKYNSATWWPCFENDLKACANFGTGFEVEYYKRGDGVKKVKPKAPGVAFVKVKNKPNHIKAVQYLGKYAQHKALLNEVIKTLDFLEK